ncbi:hypothetical protein ACFMBG_01480 [Leisingera sp. D0M16]
MPLKVGETAPGQGLRRRFQMAAVTIRLITSSKAVESAEMPVSQPAASAWIKQVVISFSLFPDRRKWRCHNCQTSSWIYP